MPGELVYRLLMLLVPDLGKVPGDLELHTLVRRDLRCRSFIELRLVVIKGRALAHGGC
jgi:hypothetical protein